MRLVVADTVFLLCAATSTNASRVHVAAQHPTSRTFPLLSEFFRQFDIKSVLPAIILMQS